MQATEKKLVFENGQIFYGYGFGADKNVVYEVVYNTSMVGYQEILSDSSYNQQLVCMTYPLIGNYGLADEDYETRVPTIGGFIVREYNESLANFRASKTLAEEMEEHGIPGIEGVDTRQITRMLCKEGNMRALLCDADLSKENVEYLLQTTAVPHNQVQTVSCKKRWYSRSAGVQFNVVVVDCGVKLGMVRSLSARGCNMTVVPFDTSAEEIIALAPDGILFSSGPGSPEDIPMVSALAKELWGKFPLFGVGLGHLVLAIAAGCKTQKLHNSHCGGYPVKNLLTGKLESTSQNHGYTVIPQSVKGTSLEVTHTNVSDGSIEGLQNRKDKVFSVQYYPESRPGSEDSSYLLDQFITLMESNKKGGFARA